MKSRKLMRLMAGMVSGAMLLSLCACGGSGSQKAAPAETAAKTEAPAADAGKTAGGDTTAAAEAAAPASDFKFDHRIEIMVPAGEGGGLDTTIRNLDR